MLNAASKAINNTKQITASTVTSDSDLINLPTGAYQITNYSGAYVPVAYGVLLHFLTGVTYGVCIVFEAGASGNKIYYKTHTDSVFHQSSWRTFTSA